MLTTPTSLLALSSAAVVALAGCSGPPMQRCNSDGECGVRACILGACVDARDERDARIDADDAVGDGAIDGVDDPGADDAVEPGSCTVAFADVDGDGIGAGDPVCVPSLGDGFVVDGSDCDDTDATVHAFRDVYVDADGDGFTFGSALACVGDVAPEGLRLQPGAPPLHVVEPSIVTAEQGAWNTRYVVLSQTSPVGTVRLSSFACAALPPEAVTGLEVELRLFSNDGSAVDVAVSIEGGSVVEERTVIANGTPVTFGAVEATFGAVVDPDALCDGSLALRITLVTPGTSPVQVVAALRVHGPAEDCDDADPDAFSYAALRNDGDGDGHAAGAPATLCVGAAVPADKRVRNTDCDDLDFEAFPGQERLFRRQRAAGGFDFNCNAVVEREVGDLRVVTSCERTGPNNEGCRERAETRSVPCGETFRYAIRCNNACDKVFRTVEQACR